ncbi:hypothetical protein [Virgibacillus sp. CBA3643]|uniref:hypothetical protein n=1 Tax=Virgibacillus sp. CBA3643 TaxID=2942278 RepID=UPI0035A2D40A
MDMKEICFSGPEQLLKQTEITQPALLIHSVGVTRLLEREGNQLFRAFELIQIFLSIEKSEELWNELLNVTDDDYKVTPVSKKAVEIAMLEVRQPRQALYTAVQCGLAKNRNVLARGTLIPSVILSTPYL